MPYPIKDCQCEDFPCCEHADNFPNEDPMAYYCDICGFSHSPNDCPDDGYYEEDYDEDDESPFDDPPTNSVAALISAAKEYDRLDEIGLPSDPTGIDCIERYE